jgi:CSLREA domain-containing protein
MASINYPDAHLVLNVYGSCPAPTIRTVTKTADTNDGACDAGCSLREAVAAAGSGGAPDLILFSIPANSAGCTGSNCTITLSSLLAPAADSGKPTTIDGATGPNTITLSGNNATQILSVGNGVRLTAFSLNLTGGSSSNGGAIALAGGGALTLINSTLFGNTAANGGAIFVDANGLLNLTNVTISGNAVTSGFRIAGGIYCAGAATATNCTVSNNSARFEGGVALIGSGYTFNIGNTIIAGNTATDVSPDANGNFTSQGYNLIGDPSGANGFTAPGDQTGVNAQLASLANNGGKTRTHALQAGSPAINTGGDTLAPLTDQRGFARSGVSDKGAFEFNGAPPFSLTSAVSRKTHGGAGDFDIDLLNANFGPECRSSGGNHTLMLTFTNNVTIGSASVTNGTGSVSGSPSFSGNTMTVSLTGVTDVQKITVTLSNVTDSFAQVLPDTAVSMNMLIGDTSGNKTVNASDIGQTKGQSGTLVTAANFRTDVNANGSINASDIGLVKSRSGTFLPP